MAQSELVQFLPVLRRRVSRPVVGAHEAIRFEATVHIAMHTVSSRSLARMCSGIAYPINSRAQQSIGEAEYDLPCHVLMFRRSRRRPWFLVARR
jgi:hypothetical protein